MNDMVLVERLVEGPVKEETVGGIIMPPGTKKTKHGPELARLINSPLAPKQKTALPVYVLHPLALGQGIQVEGDIWLINYKNIAAVIP